jgi:hypothetical protein
MYVPLGMILVITPPTVSIPRDSGVISTSTTSLMLPDWSPQRIPP